MRQTSEEGERIDNELLNNGGVLLDGMPNHQEELTNTHDSFPLPGVTENGFNGIEENSVDHGDQSPYNSLNGGQGRQGMVMLHKVNKIK